MNDCASTWRTLLANLISNGDHVSPRGQLTRELPQQTITVDMTRPVLTIPERKLSYQFMAAEAYWILTEDNRVSTIAPYNKRITEFSDDGETFFGAYGPKIGKQLPYVLQTLARDRDSRQAGITIWRESPPLTKDVPCTVAAFFSVRKDLLNVHMFMRSSDAWLGVPYDIFNFSMLGHWVCAHLNLLINVPVKPGTLFLTMASSHLYERNFDAAQACLANATEKSQSPTPEFWRHTPGTLLEVLAELRESKPGDTARWWER